MPPAQVQRGDSSAVAQAQDNTQNLMREVATNPLMRGVLLEGVEVTGGVSTQITHGLGRPFIGWVVCDATVVSNYPKNTTATADKKTSLSLYVTTTDTLTLWVF